MRKNFFKIITWLGIFSVMGPGTSVKNNFDQIFHFGGLFLVTVGFLGLLASSRTGPNPDIRYRTRQQRIRQKMGK